MLTPLDVDDLATRGIPEFRTRGTKNSRRVAVDPLYSAEVMT
jgi:hypothetical protein